MEVKAATANRSGELRKTATVQTDDPEKATIKLTIIANVVVENDLETKNVRFSGAEIGKETIVKVPFLSSDQKALSFGKVTSSKDDITAAMVHDESATGGSWSLEVRMTPAAAGHVTAKLDVEMLAPEKKTIVVFASAKVAGDIRVLPDMISIHAKAGDDVAPRKIRLRAAKGTFKVKKVVEKSGDLDVELQEETPGEVYVLTVGITKQGLAKQGFQATITVHTSSKLQPVIEIPVRMKTIPQKDDASKNK
ncbi:MAG: hypothetical protein JRG91_20775 [Deltaproteobacteria bacterium]|nr:hypothetical protein [Deltaproteobacteria bacterium]